MHDAERAIRNDTGVYEGGEISTFYDPMIAKLCSWAPTRAEAIGVMQEALDQFEVEGVGNNIAFLSAVMAQERFRSGRLTTGYIAEEFPAGFSGVTLSRAELTHLAALACCSAYALGTRGFVNATPIANGRETRRTVLIGAERWDFDVRADGIEFWLTDPHGKKLLVESGWKPGMTLAIARVDGDLHHFRLDRTSSGFRLRWRGADIVARVLLPHVADLMPLMPVKVPPDLSRFLLCPMPGQVVRIDVKEGDVVEDGQPLAIVEAMKMENVLKAEKRARVSKVRVAPGAVLAVDEVILEFEAI
jgi:propionyl-CoA carboxylase alpha chain